jgi:heterodisulfide reductase subunit A
MATTQQPALKSANGTGTADSVLVIGGGVGGMRAAIDLADAGIHVYLLESTPSLGGRVAQLGFMFPTHDCVLCRGTSDHGFGCTRPSISPALLDHNRHPNITLLNSSELISCDGEAGDFRISLERRPQFVDPNLCTNCGRCAEVCPEIRPSGFQLGLSTRKAIDKSAPRSVPNSYYLLERTDKCDDCGECLKVCPTNAIDLNRTTCELQIHVGAIILAMGFQPFDPSEMPELGYGRIPNVITSMQYERLASRSGPTEGVVRRISDGEIPKRIAWLQCVGSRDQRNPYCSSICCMYATKEAMLAKQRNPDVECHIFTMDERAFNKEYNIYYKQARDQFGIHYTRCRISAVEEDPATGEIILRYPGGRRHEESASGQGSLQEQHFDLLVLAVGIRPPSKAVDISKKLGIELNTYGFCETDKFSPLSTTRPGVFVCGAFASPKEIGETILDASGAAAEVMKLLHDKLGSRNYSRANPYLTLKRTPLYAEEVLDEPRIAVALCGCAGEISDVVNLEHVTAFIRTIPGVIDVTSLPLACFHPGQDEIKTWVQKSGANRFVIGACSHRTHEPFFQKMVAECGLNPYLVEMVNIREQCAWVHISDPEGATRKASELMRLGVERIRHSEPIYKEERKPAPSALVIGGGVSGMTAALTIADAGYDVHLVERQGELGGNLHHIYYVAEDENPQRLLRDLVNRVVGHDKVHQYLNSEVISHTGSVGDFRSRITTQMPDGSTLELETHHSVVIVATGGKEAEVSQYHFGDDPRIIRQTELEEILTHNPERVTRLSSVVMIQCVEAEGNVEYCSRICCTNTIKNALRLKMLNPDCQVVILYKNIITYGFRETHYLEARRRGILFVRYTEDEPPVVSLHARGAGEALTVSIHEHIFGKTLEFEPDLLALSMPLIPSRGTEKLSDLFGVPLSQEGFFLETHLKMRPMEFHDEGIYLCGMAHYPKFIEESITHSLACAGRALTVLSRDILNLGGVIAEVESEKCTGCLTCFRTCPFGIPEMRYEGNGVGGLGGSAWIDPARCQGCGTCTAECPARAIQLHHYRDEQIRIGLGEWQIPSTPVPTRPLEA